MATTAITTAGKYRMFKTGWKNYANKIKLYTDLGTLVDTQTVTFSYNSTNKTIEPTADVVFDVSSGTNDVSYVELIYDDTSTDTVLYTKELPALYDFPTAGTLTIDNWAIGITSSDVTDTGKSNLLQNGWESKLIEADLLTSSDVVVDTNVVSFTANAGTGALNASATIVFDVSAGTSNVAKIQVGDNPSLFIAYYTKSFSTTYSFTNAGTLSVSGFTISLF
jgi:hypothetical protein